MASAKSKAAQPAAPDADLLAEAPLSAPQDTPSATDASQPFEASLTELEAVVQRLESGELTLEQSLEAYQRGVQLVRHCQDRLQQAEAQVKVLDGDLLRPLENDDLRGDA